MINEVRKYFQDRIREVNPDLSEHDNPFDEHIPETIIEDTYIMKIGGIESNFINQTIEDSMSVEIKIYRSGENDILDNFYQFYQDAHMIRLCCIDPRTSRNGKYIKNVVCTKILPSKKEDNDNMIIYSLQFKLMLSFELDYT